jgi:hypothetical protein
MRVETWSYAWVVALGTACGLFQGCSCEDSVSPATGSGGQNAGGGNIGGDNTGGGVGGSGLAGGGGAGATGGGGSGGHPPAVWCTVDDYQLAPGQASSAAALAFDNAGGVIVAGNGHDGTSSHWILRRSADGTTFQGLDDYQFEGGFQSAAFGIEVDPAGNWFASGLGVTSSTSSHWIVRKSSNQGGSWDVVDDFTLVGEASARNPIAAHGAIWVTGQKAIDGFWNWAVRKGENDGTSWNTADTFQLAVNKHSFPYQIGVDAAGSLYVTGYGTDASDLLHLVTRRSTNMGADWSTVDDFQVNAAASSVSLAFGTDGSGAVYTCGYGTDSNGIRHWIVRSSTDGGAVWGTSDDYQLEAGEHAACVGLGTDASGNIIALGSSADVNGVDHAILRRLEGGNWTTIEDFVYIPGQNTQARALKADASGVIFALFNGDETLLKPHWLVRRYPCN